MLAKRLADLYAGQLMAAAEDKDQYDRLLTKIDRLTQSTPEANTPSLSVMLLEADYNRAEKLVARWIESREATEPIAEARTILGRIAPKLYSLQTELNNQVNTLHEEIESLTENDDRRATKEKEVARLQSVAGRASYFAGWANFYFGLTAQDAATKQAAAASARKVFRQLIGIEDDEPYEEIETSWLPLDSSWLARSLIGLGLTESLLGNTAGSRHCFRLIESPSVAPAIRDQAAYWYLRSLLFAERYDEAVEYAQKRVDDYDNNATQGKVSFCAELIRAGFTGDKESRSAEVRQLGQLGITGLTKLRQFGPLKQLLAKYNVDTDAESGFLLKSVSGQRQFEQAEKSGKDEDYQSAIELLTQALADPEADTEVAVAADCQNFLGWSYYRLGDFTKAAQAFRAASNGLKSSSAKQAVEAAWMAFVSYRRASDDARSTNAALEVLEQIQRDFPGTSYAEKASYQIAKLKAGIANDNEAIDRLKEIDSENPNYLAAQYDLCGLLYRRWEKIRGDVDKAKQTAAELRQAVDNYVAKAGESAGNQKLNRMLLVAKASLGNGQTETAQQYLQRAETLAAGLPDSDSAVADFHGTALRLSRLLADDGKQEYHAEWLIKNAPGSTHEAAALIALAKSIDVQIASAGEDKLLELLQSGYEVCSRLSAIWGDDTAAIEAAKNARVAVSRRADYAAKLGNHSQAAKLLDRLLEVYPKDRGYLQRAANAHRLSGNPKLALKLYNTLLDGLERGTDDWIDAKYNQLRCLQKTDKALFRKVFGQFELMYPDLGGPKWRDQFLQLRRTME